VDEKYILSNAAIEDYCRIFHGSRSHYETIGEKGREEIRDKIVRILSDHSTDSDSSLDEIAKQHHLLFSNPSTIKVKEYGTALFIGRENAKWNLIKVLRKKS
jgi:4-hydroxy-3-methylbut-2-enyl diphosphate reductase IspH